MSWILFKFVMVSHFRQRENMRTVELLSPARNLQCGIAAVNHGADAVYIGGPQFGARASACNTLQDIEHLVSYAHPFRTKVYVTLNTILSDDELEPACALIHRLYEAGVDALIVQDYALLKMDLPPISLHSSTQMDTRTSEKVQFLSDIGFSQVVLARELTLQQIRDISRKVKVPLEVFVHGSLCVSYSGQCYLSQAIMGRSANRGECGQPCRLSYDLYDADGRLLVEKKHLLSLKDMDRSAYISDLIDAGVSSFKIEGRLKEAEYVKNVTAYYRQAIDRALEGRPEVRRASSGSVRYTFRPEPSKTFSRGGTDYFLTGERRGISSPHTPKSIGEEVGTVGNVGRGFIDVEHCRVSLHNGDGFCFLSGNGTFYGFRVNRVEGHRLFVPASTEVWKALERGVRLRRNIDQEFQRLLSADNSGVRTVGLRIVLTETQEGYRLSLTDEDGLASRHEFEYEHNVAKQSEKALDSIERTLGKLGSTIYYPERIDVNIVTVPFIPASVLSEMRRKAVESHDRLRRLSYVRPLRKQPKSDVAYPERELTYLSNVHNHLAEEFLREHGVRSIVPSYERKPLQGVALMFCRHCIRYEIGLCAKHTNPDPLPIRETSVRYPLYMQTMNNRLRLEFDCSECEMRIYKADRTEV